MHLPNEQFKELNRPKSCLMNGIVFVVALVDFIRSFRDEVLDTVPGTTLAGNVKEGTLLLPGKPVVLPLLHE